MDYTTLVSELIEITKAAGAAILEIYHAAEGIKIDKKADNSPLTEADKAANAIICKGLENLPTQFPIISEENKAIPYETRKEFDTFWLVDPLDGTKEFIKRNGEFTVNIALVQGNRPVLGIVGVPCQDKIYWAVKGEGAFLVEDGKATKLKAPSFKMNDKGLRVVCSRSHLNADTQAILDKLDQPVLVPTGSSLKFMIIASGQADFYPRLGPTMEWDTGAAQIVLEEAGGAVINHETNSPLNYNKENLLNPYFMAYGRLLR